MPAFSNSSWPPVVCLALPHSTRPLMLAIVYALYGRSQRIFRVLLWAFVTEYATMIVFTVLTARTVRWFGLCATYGISFLSVGIGFILWHLICVRALMQPQAPTNII